MAKPVSVWLYMAAASVIVAVILLSVFYHVQKNSPQQLADNYIQQNFKNLSVTGEAKDSLQTGLNLFNSGKLAESMALFENLAKDSANSKAQKFAGIVALRKDDYSKAIIYFNMLEAKKDLHSNPGKFYKALTLLKRNDGKDKDTAKQLLNEVIAKDLEGKNQALNWMRKL